MSTHLNKQRGLLALMASLTWVSLASALPTNAERLGPAADDDAVNAVFVLRSRDEPGLGQLARAVSDPRSPEYGHYVPIEDSIRRFGPEPGAARAVAHYLRAQGLAPRIDNSGLYVEARLTAAKAPVVAGVALARYRLAAAAESIVLGPDGQRVIPTALAPYVEAITGLDQTPMNAVAVRPYSSPYNSNLPRTGTPSGCPAGIRVTTGFSPNQWRTAYGLDQLHTQGWTGAGERLAVIETDGFFPTDLATYARCFELPMPSLAVRTVPPLKTAYKPQHLSETILDLSVIAAAAPGLDGIEIYDAPSDISGIAKGVLAALSAPAAVRPTVISISLGQCEPWIHRADTGLMEKALKHAATAGVTVVVASGDTGAAACRINAKVPGTQPPQEYVQAAYLLSVQYPASSRWATAAGGTNLKLNANNSIDEEIVWNDGYLVSKKPPIQTFGAGTGGVSRFFPKPNWQLTVNTPADATEGHRLVPDVALLADNFPGYAICCHKGDFTPIGGTSAAAPLMAAATAVMNQARLVAHQARLGFLNPRIYHIAQQPSLASTAFHDVVTGNNDVGARIVRGRGPFGRWYAEPGYDLASGWGSPKFPGFLTATMQPAK